MWDLPEADATKQRAVLQANKQAAAASRTSLAKLLPESMQQEAQQRLAAAQPLQQRYRSIVDLADTWQQLQEQHAEVCAPVARFLAQRRALLHAKHCLIAERYKDGVGKFQEYLKGEQEAAVAAAAAAAAAAPTTGTGWGGSRAGAGSRGTRNNPAAQDPYQQAVVKSVYEEQQLMSVFRAVEDLKHMSVLPQQFQDAWQARWAGFASNNGLVEDPKRELAVDKVGLDWTAEEKRIFMEKFLQFPKNFRAISSYLPHRTPAECVVFFYKHQKLDEFANVRRKQQLKKRRQTAETKRVWASGRPLAISALQEQREQREQRYQDRQKERDKAAERAAERAADRGADGYSRGGEWAVAAASIAERAGSAAAGAGGGAAAGGWDFAGMPGQQQQQPGLQQQRSMRGGRGRSRGRGSSARGAVAVGNGDDDDEDVDYNPFAEQIGVAIGTGTGGFGRRPSAEDGAGVDGGLAGGGWPDDLFVAAVLQHGRNMSAISNFMAAAGFAKNPNYAKWFFGRHRKRLGLDEVADRGLAERRAAREAAAAASAAAFGGSYDDGEAMQHDAAAAVAARHALGYEAAVAAAAAAAGQQFAGLGPGDAAAAAAAAVAAAMPGGELHASVRNGGLARLEQMLQYQQVQDAAAAAAAAAVSEVPAVTASAMDEQQQGQDDEDTSSPADAAQQQQQQQQLSWPWTDDEKASLLECFRLFGRDWQRLAEAVPSRSLAQVKAYYQSNRQQLLLDRVEAAAPGSAAAAGSRGRGSSSRVGSVSHADLIAMHQRLQAAGSSDEYAAAAVASAAARAAQDTAMQQQQQLYLSEQRLAGVNGMPAAASEEDAEAAWQRLAAARIQQAAATEGLAGAAGSANNLLALLRDSGIVAAHGAVDAGTAVRAGVMADIFV
jgi:hypothetical protein